jgi:hypothetical protein
MDASRRVFEDWLARGIIAALHGGYTVFSSSNLECS